MLKLKTSAEYNGRNEMTAQQSERRRVIFAFLALFALVILLIPHSSAYADRTVWVSRTGTKYHYTQTCSNMKNPIAMTESEAKAKGKKACLDCVNGSSDSSSGTGGNTSDSGSNSGSSSSGSDSSSSTSGSGSSESQGNLVAPFSDVYTSTAHNEDISWLYQQGITQGWASNGSIEYRPYANIARADMAAFLYRLADSPEYTAPSTSPFVDCNADTYHYKEICWLVEEGISEGWTVTGGKEFRPYATVARCDMAAFLYRMAGLTSYTTPSVSPFKDCNSNTPHYEEVCWLAEAGISAGWDVTGGKEFRSYNQVARADMAAFLHRMSNKNLV